MIFGIFLGVLMSILLASSHYVAYNLGKKSRITPIKEEISEEEKERIKLMQEGIANVMNYSVEVASGRR